MNIDDVLLTDDEICVVCEECPKPICEMASKDEMCEKHLKAQCLKLLEWLRGRCPHTMRIGDMEHWQRFNCPKCMTELESKLKEV